MQNKSRQSKEMKYTRTICACRNLEIRNDLSLWTSTNCFTSYEKVYAVFMVTKVALLPLGWLIQNLSHLQNNPNTINDVIKKLKIIIFGLEATEKW